MAHIDDPVPSFLLGRGANGQPLDGVHLAIVPLPFIGASYADGSILGVALVLPRECRADDRRALAQALVQWESAGNNAKETLPLMLGTAGRIDLRRETGLPRLQTLKPWTWCGFDDRGRLRGASRWATATPIALDRNPGELQDRDPGRAAEAARKAEHSIAEAAANIGLPRPAVQVVPAAPLRGAAKARAFPRYPATEAKIQRVLTHAYLEFPQPVRGPIILGAGRYRGLGLCRPLFKEQDAENE